MRKLFVPLSLAAAIISTPALGATLQDVAMAAWGNDHEWEVARKTWMAAQETEKQGLGGLLPQITADYTHVRNHQHVEGSPISVGGGALNNPYSYNFETQAATVSVVQPLFRVDTWYEYQRSKAVTSAAEASFTAARQQFLLRVTEQYMNVLRTRENLTTAYAEERALKRQLEQTNERYKVGLVPITDVNEAQAAYDLSRVGLIVGQSDFQIARDQLEALTGKRWDSIDGLKTELPMAGPEPSEPEPWVEQAQANNPQVVSARFNAETAKAVSKQGLGAQMPSVNLIGQYQHKHTLDLDTNQLSVNSIELGSESNYYGVQVSMPIFTGGSVNSKRKQAALNYQATEEQYKLVWRDTGQQTRSLHRVVEADVLRVQARRQALVSAQSALKATESGYSVGTRNVVDVVIAQRNMYSAQRDYAGARYDYILDSLRLKAAAGILNEEDLGEVNGWLDSNGSIELYGDLSQLEDTTETTR
ncbi:MAG: TolC family outer membrane protein [Alcanivoracaceae bacterium]|nr:TolC family outer membrane protein [Alcanivoracaceae bacterium]